MKSEARRRAEKELDDLVKKIRQEPGFERLLLPPSEEQFMKAADPDPVVVVDVSDLRCDAFVVTRDGIRLLELPKITLDGVQGKARQIQRDSVSLGSTLPWLWDVLASPVLEALDFTSPPSSADSREPHMWRIPVGPLNFLPVHAAGYHGKQTGETALDRVISSYGSSIKSLLAARPTMGSCS
ncbi:hypothetical protein QBC40DRAFT_257750 [Triangularia verruculosa]|uniref:Uncharacterized protein n=1 Tax=Triangularia verruculosa TaxID=2587418 RepID=A0AAN7ARS2_9PEZI|nr:hypothetical protein QBC40DRAFT_257750 [Triangularia verruculosa]